MKFGKLILYAFALLFWLRRKNSRDLVRPPMVNEVQPALSPTRAPAPDSSDIAKNVKTIHLTLVFACMLVVTILLGGSPTSVESAHDQLLNVRAVIANWKDWTRKFGHEQVTWLRENGLVPAKILSSQIFVSPDELARRNLPQQTQEWSVSVKYLLYFYLNVRQPITNSEREEILAWAQQTQQGVDVNAGGLDTGPLHY